MKFRKRPVVVEAVRWTGSNVDEVAAFFGTPPAIVAACISSVLGEYRLPIVTLEGVVTASPGDWIIRGVKGEYYLCKPDIFERTYEAADAATPDAMSRPRSRSSSRASAHGRTRSGTSTCDASSATSAPTR